MKVSGQKNSCFYRLLQPELEKERKRWEGSLTLGTLDKDAGSWREDKLRLRFHDIDTGDI